MLFATFEICHGLFVTLTILPSDINEFFLIGEHVTLVKLVNLHQFTMFVPPIHASVERSGLVPLEQSVHADTNCF